MAGNAASNEFLGVFEDAHSSSASFSSTNVVFGPTPRAGTLRNLTAVVDDDQSQAGRSWTITILAGTTAPGTATAVTCTIAGIGPTSCSSGALNAALPAGSFVTVRVTGAGSGVQARQWRYSFEY